MRIVNVKQTEKGITFKHERRTLLFIEKATGKTRKGKEAAYHLNLRGMGGLYSADEFYQLIEDAMDFATLGLETTFHGIEKVHAF